jgi:hypothetical protein
MSEGSAGASDALIVANGVDGSTGQYLFPPLRPRQVAALARGESIDPTDLAEMKAVDERCKSGTYGPREGIDPKKLAETGWGVLFAQDADPAIREALRPLLELRRSQAAATKEHFYKEFVGPQGYRPGQSHREFLARNGTSPGMQADPECVPYYVLIVGDPESIPFSFQFQLDVVYATGRIHFDTLEEYERYARSVVEAESGRVTLARQAAFFGVQNPGDAATRLSAEFLVRPLADKLAARADWSVQTLVGEPATKARLARLLGGDETPAILFTASHGMGFPSGDPRQLADQGALLCQDWPGPRAGQPIPPEQYFSADDVGDDASLLGLIAVLFACYGAGTPKEDEFAHRLGGERKPIAERAFLARLPRRLLAHPRGGALAVVGHVERAWGYSFHWPLVGQQTQVFEDFQTRLLDGHPIGSAVELFNLRYAGLAAELSATLEEIKFGKRVEDLPLANMWTANNDAKNYVILGDPAARLPVGDTAGGQVARPTIAAVVRPPLGPAAEEAGAPTPPAAPPEAGGPAAGARAGGQADPC